MNVLLVEPHYYTKYPPLGLMKLVSYHRSRANKIKLLRGIKKDFDFNPDIIEVTSLFTYAWRPVHEVIEYYHKKFPQAQINVGGIYASLMPARLKKYFPFIHIHQRLFSPAEEYLPAYDILQEVDKWKNWDSSILFSSRGCIRNCPFCVVPKLEGTIRSVITDVENYIYPGHKKIILWDNNFLASPDWKVVIKKLKDLNMKVDFNQGLDARLIDEEKAGMLAELKLTLLRLAYDDSHEKIAVRKAIDLLSDHGILRRKILLYTLYNFYDINNKCGDNPDSFFTRIKEIAEMGCASYPMRFEPLTSLKKNQYVSPLWTSQQLEIIAKVRRVIGFGGAFPPYEGLVKKFMAAKDFKDAFSLYPKGGNNDLEIHPLKEIVERYEILGYVSDLRWPNKNKQVNL